MEAQQITSLADLIDKLGGTVAATRALEAKRPSVVSNWLKRGNIPPRLSMKHRAILERRGLSAAPSIWFGDEA